MDSVGATFYFDLLLTITTTSNSFIFNILSYSYLDSNKPRGLSYVAGVRFALQHFFDSRVVSGLQSTSQFVATKISVSGLVLASNAFFQVLQWVYLSCKHCTRDVNHRTEQLL